MRLFALLFFVVNFAFAGEVQRDSNYIYHKVDKGEHIADILRIYKKEPLWGTKGYVQTFIDLNQIENGNSIDPGKVYKIPHNLNEVSTRSQDKQSSGFQVSLHQGEKRIHTTKKEKSEIDKKLEEIHADGE